ncbi:hypothetical protein HAX54_048930 [Datura stramonium]|uniref:Uncharacterized protein n=1 Tax=Datura stramonium TaxID=4076 RepID=A0ABS8SUU3_DATST|nr:hypothetical protein [Datura stramonium]
MARREVPVSPCDAALPSFLMKCEEVGGNDARIKVRTRMEHSHARKQHTGARPGAARRGSCNGTWPGARCQSPRAMEHAMQSFPGAQQPSSPCDGACDAAVAWGRARCFKRPKNGSST